MVVAIDLDRMEPKGLVGKIWIYPARLRRKSKPPLLDLGASKCLISSYAQRAKRHSLAICPPCFDVFQGMKRIETFPAVLAESIGRAACR